MHCGGKGRREAPSEGDRDGERTGGQIETERMRNRWQDRELVS